MNTKPTSEQLFFVYYYANYTQSFCLEWEALQHYFTLYKYSSFDPHTHTYECIVNCKRNYVKYTASHIHYLQTPFEIRIAHNKTDNVLIIIEQRDEKHKSVNEFFSSMVPFDSCSPHWPPGLICLPSKPRMKEEQIQHHFIHSVHGMRFSIQMQFLIWELIFHCFLSFTHIIQSAPLIPFFPHFFYPHFHFLFRDFLFNCIATNTKLRHSPFTNKRIVHLKAQRCWVTLIIIMSDKSSSSSWSSFRNWTSSNAIENESQHFYFRNHSLFRLSKSNNICLLKFLQPMNIQRH